MITDVEILDVKATPFKDLHHKKKSLNLAEYSKHAVNMYDGKKVSAIVRLKEERIGDIVDWFGKDITVLSREEDGHIRCGNRFRQGNSGVGNPVRQAGRGFVPRLPAPSHPTGCGGNCQ